MMQFLVGFTLGNVVGMYLAQNYEKGISQRDNQDAKVANSEAAGEISSSVGMHCSQDIHSMNTTQSWALWKSG
ncbi:hypothetical protein PDJAM_G00088330 [Pangasius djambal]|uniref:Uncharacterized protein n=1 Tax=Pangasius djambal TaxID=1691987 RepID=A0ACC5Z4B2_9TELE|nr:hypothetical protein [Pangasius djambal]